MEQRIIKFRAWDKEEKIMCSVYIINFDKGCFLVGNSPTEDKYINGGKTILIGPKEGHFVNFEDLELMQFTGLLDKHGKEIYEGDILERFGTRDIFSGSYEDKIELSPISITIDVVNMKVCKDEFGNQSFGYSLSTQKTYSERTHPATYEIVGNIFETPELIK